MTKNYIAMILTRIISEICGISRRQIFNIKKKPAPAGGAQSFSLESY